MANLNYNSLSLPKQKKLINHLSQAWYYTHWKELPNGDFPRIWENTTEEIRDFVRARITSVLQELSKIDFDRIDFDNLEFERPGSLNPPVR
jgi:hypothetical protein